MKEYVEAIRGRYGKADRREEWRMLEEVTQVTGYHRKSAIRLLRAATEGSMAASGRGRPRAYGPEVVHALKVVWEVADRVCSKRIAPFVSELVQALERHGELTLAEAVKVQLLRMSPSTMDRVLKPYRQQGSCRPLSTTKPGTLLKTAIPIRTFSEWDERWPGFVEMAQRMPIGMPMRGPMLTDIAAI
ncbi:MAG: hypothetical protein V1724_06640 [Chloroflexota bacterium]